MMNSRMDTAVLLIIGIAGSVYLPTTSSQETNTVGPGEAYQANESPVVSTINFPDDFHIVPTLPPGSVPVTAVEPAEVLAPFARGQCLPRAEVFFAVPEVERAVATGSIHPTAHVLRESFAGNCPKVGFYRYRTIDGSCNHVESLGRSLTPVDRLLPAEYDDGDSCPRITAKDGSPLPSARNVSRVVHPAFTKQTYLTHMVMQWGQWLDHDLTALPVAAEFDRSIKCCGERGGNPPFTRNKNCFPIELPGSEDHFPGSCMEFTRSLPVRDPLGEELRPREQINTLTAFIDASQVYGSTEERFEELRDKENRILLRTNGTFLPASEEMDCIHEEDEFCFFAGDVRVNEQPGLASMHTIFVREHNRIARELKRLRSNDSPEEIFQLTRKIIGALQQTITYNEWLPIIMGNGIRRYNLRSARGRSTYNPGMDPRIFNAFSAAAMRFGHSLIPEKYIIGKRLVPLRNLFNRVTEVFKNLDDVVAGLAGVAKKDFSKSPLQPVDRNFVEEITKFLFIPDGGRPNSGFDLVSLNIQRGRDHGIPPYVKFRNLCGLRPLTGFDDTEALGEDSEQLGLVYGSVHDIDLFTGLMHEPPAEGGLVGPTLQCLLGIQFSRVKFGDRYFFDTDNTFFGFNNAQLRAIRKTTLASVICSNTGIPKLPENVFVLNNESSNFNPPKSCTKIVRRYGLDLNLFADS